MRAIINVFLCDGDMRDQEKKMYLPVIENFDSMWLPKLLKNNCFMSVL